MAWIESHQSLGTHKKLYKLATLLGISRPAAVGHLHYLWWWALDNAPEGNLAEIPNEVIAEVSLWPGKPDDFYNALLTSGWLDEDGFLHDWQDYAGKLIRRRDSDKIRHRTSLGNPQELIRNSTATVPNSTIHNSTKENNIKEIPAWINRKNWDSFLEMRRKMKRYPTYRGQELLIAKLESLRQSGCDPNEVLNQSIMNNWQGVFELKGRNNGTNQGHVEKAGSFGESIRRPIIR